MLTTQEMIRRDVAHNPMDALAWSALADCLEEEGVPAAAGARFTASCLLRGPASFLLRPDLRTAMLACALPMPVARFNILGDLPVRLGVERDRLHYKPRRGRTQRCKALRFRLPDEFGCSAGWARRAVSRKRERASPFLVLPDALLVFASGGRARLAVVHPADAARVIDPAEPAVQTDLF